MMSNAAKYFSNSLNVLHNYSDGPTKLFSNLYLAKIVFS